MFQAPRPRSRLAQSMMKPQYVASPGQLPHQFRPPGVGMPHNLPAHIGFGPVAPGPSQNSAFTGGRVASPLASFVHAQAPQSFSAPSFGPGGPAAPSLAPFVSTPQGGEPTKPVAAAADVTGATPAPPPPPHPPAPAQTPLTLDTLIRAGVIPTQQQQGNLLPPNLFNTPSTGSGFVNNGGFQFAPTDSTLTTILAQAGIRRNPSAAARQI